MYNNVCARRSYVLAFPAALLGAPLDSFWQLPPHIAARCVVFGCAGLLPCALWGRHWHAADKCWVMLGGTYIGDQPARCPEICFGGVASISLVFASAACCYHQNKVWNWAWLNDLGEGRGWNFWLARKKLLPTPLGVHQKLKLQISPIYANTWGGDIRFFVLGSRFFCPSLAPQWQKYILFQKLHCLSWGEVQDWKKAAGFLTPGRGSLRKESPSWSAPPPEVRHAMSNTIIRQLAC